MDDNTAVSWSEYSANRAQIEYEVRHKIARELLEYIGILESNKDPECFIQGVNRARNIVLLSTKINSVTDEVDSQEKLF